MTTRYEELREQARTFHRAHPEVWEMFCQYAFNRIGLGFKHYSSRAIFHRIRWETSKPTYEKGEEFKINNHITPFYSRGFMKKFPKHEGFFKTRKQLSKESGATGRPEMEPIDDYG